MFKHLRYAIAAVLIGLWLSAFLAAQPAPSMPPLEASTGETAPDGTSPICELPRVLRKKNIASRGLGCCVFRSIDYAAHWQNMPQLNDFPEWMVQTGIPGGGYPQKVDDLIPKICAARGLPVPDYIQVENNDLEILKLALKTGRIVCMTYGISATGRYGGSSIAHMVTCVGGPEPGKDGYWFILDNNYVDTYEILNSQEFLRTYTYGSRTGWSIIFLNPSPPLIPKNKV